MLLKFSKELKKEYARRMRERMPELDYVEDNIFLTLLKHANSLLLRAFIYGLIIRTPWFFMYFLRPHEVSGRLTNYILRNKIDTKRYRHSSDNSCDPSE